MHLKKSFSYVYIGVAFGWYEQIRNYQNFRIIIFFSTEKKHDVYPATIKPFPSHEHNVHITQYTVDVLRYENNFTMGIEILKPKNTEKSSSLWKAWIMDLPRTMSGYLLQ